MPSRWKIPGLSLIAAFAVAAALSAGRAPEPVFPAEPVKLTSGEAALAKGIFSREVDTEIIRKIYDPVEESFTSASVNNEREIRFYRGYHAADYSLTNDVTLYGAFFHETTHIWQRQSRSEPPACAEFGYRLSKERRFETYCREQQAMIVEDYARRFVYDGTVGYASRAWRSLFSGGRPETAWNQGRPGLAGMFFNRDTPETDALLRKVVEDRFPGAQQLRLNRK